MKNPQPKTPKFPKINAYCPHHSPAHRLKDFPGQISINSCLIQVIMPPDSLLTTTSSITEIPPTKTTSRLTETPSSIQTPAIAPSSHAGYDDFSN